MISSLVQYRSFILRHALSDLRHRYAATGMGMVWNVLHPLVQIAVYALVFTQLMSAHIPDLPGGRFGYTIYLCSGFFPWVAFVDCVTRGCHAFVRNAGYLKKLPIPEQIFVAQHAATSTLNLCINFTLVLLVATLLGFHPSVHWLVLPIPLLLLLLTGFGFGMLLGTLNVFFRDVGEWLGLILQLMMWTAPIIYVSKTLPWWAQRVQTVHPMMPVLRAIRDPLLHNSYPPLATYAQMAAWAVAAVAAGFACLAVLRREIRDVI